MLTFHAVARVTSLTGEEGLAVCHLIIDETSLRADVRVN